MSLISLRSDDSGKVAIISFDNGANTHNLQFAREFEQHLQTVEDNPDFKALVITSSDEKSWSQGLDVPWLMGSIQDGRHDDVKEFMHTMDRCHARLMQFPVPAIAAINGHTFGNGCVIACACDFRVMRSDRGYFCFPEVDMSIPFVPGLIDVVLKSLPAYRYNDMLLTGRRVGAAELLADHFLSAVFEGHEAVLEGALAFARTFNKKRTIFAEHKKRFHKPVLDALREKNPPFIDAMKLL
ncbi:MAG: enoyl-CoA hydratase/isomerase family protein [Saccharospirillaceae bacterium]|nr:enoyl-CoA hydratase/isomerase family protein [Saccharospirillaceae bacterium]MCD8532937.1 enoyl-CoA hydratase/isomerase family protein [Saccharospirillaceae bacterium]